MAKRKKRKLTLILAGGGLKAVSYFGFIKALEENEIEIDLFGAYSGGAWVATAHGLGKSYEEIKEILKEPWWKFMDFNMFKERSILSNKKIDQLLEGLVSNIKFSDLKTKTVIFAADITHKKLAKFDRGLIKQYMRASMALAPIISGIKIKGVEYIDAGFITAFPTTEMRKYAPDNFILGLVPGIKYRQLPEFVFRRAKYLELLNERLLELMVKEDPPDLIIETLSQDKGDMLSYKLIDYFYEEGYKIGKKWADVIEDKLYS